MRLQLSKLSDSGIDIVRLGGKTIHRANLPSIEFTVDPDHDTALQTHLRLHQCTLLHPATHGMVLHEAHKALFVTALLKAIR